MRALPVLFTTLVLSLACGGSSGDSGRIVGAVQDLPSAAGPKSKAFEIEVKLDDAAKAELTRRKERIVVDFTVSDVPTDEGTYARHEEKLPGEGGVVKVPALALTPGKLGQPLENASINVWTARESDERNLLRCDYWGDDVGNIPDRVTLNCSLL